MMYLSINKNKKFNNNVSEKFIKNILNILLLSRIILLKKGEFSFAKYIINIVIMNENVFLKCSLLFI